MTPSNVSLALGEFAQSNSRTITASVTDDLTEYDTLTLYLDADAVHDGSGNGNVAVYVDVSIYDSARPQVSSALYDSSFNRLAVQFDGNVTEIDSTLFSIGNASLQNITSRTALLDQTAYFTIAEPYRDDIVSRLVLDVQAGAAIGLNGTLSVQSHDVPIRLAAPPDIDSIRSAVYDATSGTLWLYIDGNRVILRDSEITLNEVPLSEINVMLNGEKVSAGNSTVPHTDNVTLNIPTNTIATQYGTIPASDYDVDVFGGVTTNTVSNIPLGNSTMTHMISDSANGTVYTASVTRYGVSLVDITNPADPIIRHVIPTNGTVLDIDHISLNNTTYVAILTDNSVSYHNMTVPTEPVSEIPHGSKVWHGDISHVVLDEMEYLVSISGSTVTSVSVSDVYSPVIVSGATVNNAVGGYIDSVPISADEVITTLRSDHICVLNLNDTSGIAATCDEYGGGDPVSMAHIVTDGKQRIAVTGDAPRISIHDEHLTTLSYIETDDIPSDIEVVSVYGVAYAVSLVSGNLTIYDIDDGLSTVFSMMSPYESLDVGEFGDSVYAVMTGRNGTMSIIDLAGTR